jgi:dTDP-4-dehydrorhamnose 3,5-epimerase
VTYHLSQVYVPEAARGVRWDDPAFAIDWPPIDGPRVISERDRGFPNFRAAGG